MLEARTYTLVKSLGMCQVIGLRCGVLFVQQTHILPVHRAHQSTQLHDSFVSGRVSTCWPQVSLLTWLQYVLHPLDAQTVYIGGHWLNPGVVEVPPGCECVFLLACVMTLSQRSLLGVVMSPPGL